MKSRRGAAPTPAARRLRPSQILYILLGVVTGYLFHATFLLAPVTVHKPVLSAAEQAAPDVTVASGPLAPAGSGGADPAPQAQSSQVQPKPAAVRGSSTLQEGPAQGPAKPVPEEAVASQAEPKPPPSQLASKQPAPLPASVLEYEVGHAIAANEVRRAELACCFAARGSAAGVKRCAAVCVPCACIPAPCMPSPWMQTTSS